MTETETRGLLLDFDGTLADNLSAMREVYDSFLESYGVQSSDEEFNSLNGPPLEKVVSILKETHSLPGNIDVLQKQYFSMVESAHYNSKPALGANHLLKAASQQGWKISVVTSSNSNDVWNWLRRNSFSEFIDELVGGDQVVNGKPHPEPYLLALSLLGCDADRSWAVEDSLAGAISAHAAGLCTFVIASKTDQLNWPKGVNLIDSFSDLLGYFTDVKCDDSSGCFSSI